MKKLKVGIIGVGRLGYEHACNLANRVPGVELVAICDGFEERAKEVADELGVSAYYSNPEDICKDENVDAVAIVTSTATHVDMIRLAMDNGKHVFCEKPLAENIEKCKEAEKIIESHPELTFMLGFMRRFDASYQAAKKKIENGDIGDVVLVRCCSQDSRVTVEGAIEFGPRSGGQFIDMCIHDIDLVRWISGSEPKTVWGIGGCFEFPEFATWDDGDNVACMMQCENKTMAFLFANRVAAHGSHVETEIIGTKGTLRIAAIPQNTLLEVMSEHGVCKECHQDFLTRWHEAYITEMEYFRDCVNNKIKAQPNVYDGTNSTKVAFSCKESFLKGGLVNID